MSVERVLIMTLIKNDVKIGHQVWDPTRETHCKGCGYELDPAWIYCPMCNRKINTQPFRRNENA